MSDLVERFKAMRGMGAVIIEGQEISTVCDRIAQLERENAALRKDAERLIRLRTIVLCCDEIVQMPPCEEDPEGYFKAYMGSGSRFIAYTLDDLVDDVWRCEFEYDAAIDAAMKEKA